MLREISSPKGREGARGIEATKWPQPYGFAPLREPGVPPIPMNTAV